MNELYNLETWVHQKCNQVVGDPAVLLANSVGGLVALQTAVAYPDRIKGMVLLDTSLRMLLASKQPALQVPSRQR